MYEHDGTTNHPNCIRLIFFQQKYQLGGRESVNSPTLFRFVYHLWLSAGINTKYATPLYPLLHPYSRTKTYFCNGNIM